MIISELPDRYRELAIQRRKECKKPKAKNFSVEDLRNAFVWNDTPEGEFWKKVHDAKNETELPPISEVV